MKNDDFFEILKHYSARFKIFPIEVSMYFEHFLF
eukprot:UN07746